jgi:hypothetical protein
MAYAALTDVLDGKVYGDLPIPSLPAAITTVWAATPDQGIYVTPPGKWKTFGAAPTTAA